MKNKICVSIFLFACVVALSCTKNNSSMQGSANSTTATTSTTTTIKTPIVGLVTQGSASSTDSTWVPDNTFPEANAHPNVYAAVVIRVEWKQLEPAQGQFNFAVIDSALGNIKKYNLAHPAATVNGKLRVFCGVNVPSWVKTLSGGALSMADPTTGITFSIGRFWTTEYRQAWTDLQTALAARYDGNPLVQEVAVSSCSTMTAEPFVQPFSVSTISVLHNAGFTDAAFKAALTGALNDYTAWKITALDYTFNEFRATDSGKPVTDTLFAPTLMQTFRALYGSRAVIANHGLQSPGDGSANSIYTMFLNLKRPIEFQTVSPTVNWNSTIALGLTFNPTEIEIWDTNAAGGPANVTLAQLQTWATQIGK